MMSANESTATTPANPFQSGTAAATHWTALDRFADLLSDRLNPILVKEARQALKSRQFVVTFSLLLIFAWGWSLLGISMLMPGVYYSSGGRYMLTGYYIVLAIPLLIVIPFASFRSLANEREDGTFELLSITDLSARQIITGKLGSAALQMLVYYSALSPCIAFTYLLRGLDIVSIVLVLGYTMLASLLLAAIGLLCATVARTRMLNVMVAVLLILGLAFFTLVWTYWILVVLLMLPSFDQIGFWITTAAVLSFYAAFLVMSIFAAAGQISFVSDNRSTRLRVVMAAQCILWIGWMSYLWLIAPDTDVLHAMLICAAVYWAVIGAMLVGETGQMSPRVLRTLPTTFVGRMARTWFNPGSGTGYVFAVLNFMVIAGVVATLDAAGDYFAVTRHGGNVFEVSFVMAAYLALYLGLTRLIVLLMRAKRLNAGVLASFMVMCILAVCGVLLPFFINAWLAYGFGRAEYSLLQMPNWAWTISEWMGNGAVLNGDLVWATLATAAVAILVFCVNLALAYREVERTRIAIPARVMQDEQVRHPRNEPKPVIRTDPWSGGEEAGE